MSRTISFHFVDVFADTALQGNPLALIGDGDALDTATMQAIAREFNQSETTFILSPTDSTATVRLRSFTPNGSEVFGAGHNALGAWIWLVERKLGDGRLQKLTQQIGDDILPVQASRQSDGRVLVSMAQSAPMFGKKVTDRGRLADALGLKSSALDVDHPAQVVSTGAGHLLVPLTSRSAVDSAIPDSRSLSEILDDVGGEGCYLYSLDPFAADSTAYARFFNPIMGISEDPATGTAAGPLAALLTSRDESRSARTVVIEQGYSLGRPSKIRVSVKGDEIRVSGSGLIVADGTLYL